MKWDLTFFYDGVDDPQIQKDIDETLKRAAEFEEKYQKILKDKLNAETLRAMCHEQEAIETMGAKAAQFSGLLFSEDTQNMEAQKLAGKIQNAIGEMEEHFSFIIPTLLTHDVDELKDLMKEVPEYAWAIERILERKEHTLSAETEKVLAAKSVTGRSDLGDLYSKITSAYSFELEIDGEKKTLNGSQVRNLRYTGDSNTRRTAMKVFFNRYKDDSTVITGLYNNIIKDYDVESKFRKYQSPISMKNMDNEIEDSIVESLIESTVKNAPLVARYYSWKAKKMNLELELADIYAPLEDVKKEYSFEESRDLVIETYSEFDERAGKIVRSFFDDRRIHSEVLPGKRGGAFCSYYIPNEKPFVMLNHNNNINDVLTMAHELGHGLHGTLSSKQTPMNYHTPLTMAEVASVFGEFLVFDKLLPTLSDVEKQLFLASTIEGNFATTFRQNMFARFEKKSHKLATEAGFASWDDLAGLYEEELKIMFSDSVKITEEYKWEWASIPHIFHTPFYVYAYNFANLLVIALYEKYLEEGKAMVPAYLRLLENGGNNRPDRLLEELGIDLTDKLFWQKGFDYLARLIDELN
ncbi:MAG TPA: M3 family oligoendopeptidase [Thermotogota bacterium]|nr:M3 family oligoendopeptidase [Thermotogota bacterium]HPJ89599.1 M3 family oligoendopeptidase [Thermotogota bacterium]HPR96782.1 M3 family oligoendopeptidase [Thermotogota bacterium]